MPALKRKYTVSPKVRAANRANLLKANAVPKSIRYRATPDRLRACRTNLLKARAALEVPGGRARAHGGCFTRGIHVISLEHTLALAGETQEEFDASLELFERAFAPRGKIEEKLVRGIARAAWRRLRALRGQARWEARSVVFRLTQAAQAWPPDGLHPLPPADRDRGLAEEILGIFASEFSLLHALPRLNRRLARLLRVLLQISAGNAAGFAWSTKPRESEATLLERAEVELDNPFLSRGAFTRALAPRPLEMKMKETEDWNWKEEDMPTGRAAVSQGYLPGKGKALRYGLIHRIETARAAVSGAVADRLFAGTEEENFAAFLRLFKAAFGADPKGQTRLPRSQTLSATGSDSLLGCAAQAAWERLQLYARQARQEADLLQQVLEEARQAQDEPRNRDSRILTLAAKVRLVFAPYMDVFREAVDLEQRLRGEFYKVLARRYGARRRFEHFMPESPPQTVHQHFEGLLGRLIRLAGQARPDDS